MLSEVQKIKFEYLFNLYDANNNGVVEFADFSAYVGRFTELYELPEDSETLKQLNKTAEAWWDVIKANADLNDDGVVTIEEWMGFAERYVETLETYPDGAKYLTKFIITIFNVVDENKNNLISSKEYANFLFAWGVDKDVDLAFRKLDADGDHSLSEKDMIDLVFEFYLSDDPHAPGNHFYGMIPNEIFAEPPEEEVPTDNTITRIFKSIFK